MKKTLVALAIASISSSAFAVNTSSQNSQNEDMFAFDSMHKDQFSVSGSFGVGGYYDTGSKALYDDWATGVTLAVNYRNNRIVGYFETDMMVNYTTDNNVSESAATAGWTNGIDTGPATDVDKAWLGFDTGFGIASFGWENDTALDKVDGAGDNTYEFGASAGDASDAFNVVKFQGATNGIAYAISYFETNDDHNDAEKGVNGYIGIEQEVFSVYAGYEARDDEKDYEVYTVTGSMQLGSMKLGLNSWIDQNDEMKNTGFYFSGGYTLSDDLTIAAGYAFNTNEEDNLSDVDSSYINVAAMYRIADNADMGIDIKQDIEGARSIGNTQYDEETHVFAAAYYYF